MPLLTPKQQAILDALPKGPHKSKLATTYRRQINPASAMRHKPAKEKLSRETRFKSMPQGVPQAAPRGLGYYDAFEHSPDAIALASTIGEATPISSISRFSTPDSSGNSSNGPQLLCIFNDRAGQPIGTCFNTADGTVTSSFFQATQLEVDPTIPFLPIRQSVRITNTTEVINRGGVIRVLRVNTMPRSFRCWTPGNPHPAGPQPDLSAVQDTMEFIRASPKSRTIGSSELGEAKQWNAYITDAISGASITQRDPSHMDDEGRINGLSQPMSTLLILVEAQGIVSNTFEFSVMSQRLYRFPYGSVLASMAKDVPYAPPDILHRLKKDEEHPSRNAGAKPRVERPPIPTRPFPWAPQHKSINYGDLGDKALMGAGLVTSLASFVPQLTKIMA